MWLKNINLLLFSYLKCKISSRIPKPKCIMHRTKRFFHRRAIAGIHTLLSPLLWNQMFVFSVKPFFVLLLVSLSLLFLLVLLSPPSLLSQNLISGYVLPNFNTHLFYALNRYKALKLATGHLQLWTWYIG